mmetsp:Transcript_26215/g.75644  ORF Transcript_26215/g.75644 Transcript_26215/m.75644 type:complete len:249 (+) Transcript_26215:1272-2018(+)
MSSLSALLVTCRSPSALAFASPAAASAFFSSDISCSAFLISSFKDCSNISKLCLLVVSFFLAASSWSFALSSKSSRVPKMPSLCDSYAAAAGVPGGWSSSSPSSSLDRCTNDVRRDASCELSMDASTMTDKACTKSLECLNCTKAEPPLCISRSMRPIARSSVSIASVRSFSSAAKSSASFARMPCAALRSAPSVVIKFAKSSILEVAAPICATELSIAAFRSATSAFPVLISNSTFAALSSHHSENS